MVVPPLRRVCRITVLEYRIASSRVCPQSKTDALIQINAPGFFNVDAKDRRFNQIPVKR